VVDRKAGCDFDTERWIIRVYRPAAIRVSMRVIAATRALRLADGPK
jgi:hypothetical protein